MDWGLCQNSGSHWVDDLLHSSNLTYLAGTWTRFEDVFPIEKWGIFQPAMLVYQRVFIFYEVGSL